MGVSGGADSTALLRLCVGRRGDCGFHVIHLDHETRGEESAEDARFVARLAEKLGVPCTVASRREVEPTLADRPGNRSALFRAMRHALFRRVCREQALAGVLLAHHADDQAETVLHRLLRGSTEAGLGGMAARAELAGGLVLLRPLLGVRAAELREYLRSLGQAWREDASNASPVYRRNVLRALLGEHGGLTPRLLELGECSSAWRGWLRRCAPVLAEEFSVEELRRVPQVVAAEAGRQWLVQRGAPAGELSAEVLRRFVEMACDAAAPAREHFPGKVLVRRRGGRVSAATG